MTTDLSAPVYLLPTIDVNWLTFAPFDPARGYRVDPPKIEQSIGESRQLIELMNELTDGKYVITPHSGTYCRDALYEGAFIDIYRAGLDRGAEMAIHLHEEIKGAGVRFGEEDHMSEVFANCRGKLEDAGFPLVAYRGGHYAYAPFMNALLEEHDVHIDITCSPGLDQPTREAVWVNAEFSGHYLPRALREKPEEGCERSTVFEIPMGSDGLGAEYGNVLHIEQSDMENLTRIWSVVSGRASVENRSQFVHCLFHTASMGNEDYVERLKRFLDHATANGGALVTPSEAKQLYDELEGTG